MRFSLWSRFNLRREVLLLLPLAVLFLVLLSLFTLFSFHQSARLLVDAKQEEARRLARSVAERLSGSDPQQFDRVYASLTVLVRGMALIDAEGTTLAAGGEMEATNLLGFLEDQPEGVVAVGPDRVFPDSVVALAPFRHEGRDFLVRVDLPAPELASQKRALRALTWVVVLATCGLAVIVSLFARHILQPYEHLLEQARRAQPGVGDKEDEEAFLISTFERAIEALGEKKQAPQDDDIESIQKALVSSLESGLLLLDRDGKVLTLNAVGTGLLDLPSPEAGVGIEQFLEPHRELLASLGHALESRQGFQRKEIPVRVADEERLLGLTVHALRRDDGSVRGYLCLFVDLTEIQRQAEQERISQSLEQLAELAAGIAHELRNGLATLRGYLTLIERQPEEESLTDYLAEIRKESTHLERVLNDFLTFARPGSLRSETVDLKSLIDRAIRDPVLATREVRLHLPASDSVQIQADPQLLEQAIRNLLRNAAEALENVEDLAPIDLGLHVVEDTLEISVEDRGPGLSDDVRAKLFQPFVSGRANGVGLGLSITHRIVSLHGGELTLGDRPGGGTRAVISLPLT